MDETDAQDAAVLLDAEAFGEIQRIEIAVPGEDPALAQKRGNFRWMVIAEPERQSRTTLVKSFCVRNAENSHVRNCLQPGDQPGQQCGFVLMRRAIRCLQRFAPA